MVRVPSDSGGCQVQVIDWRRALVECRLHGVLVLPHEGLALLRSLSALWTKAPREAS